MLTESAANHAIKQRWPKLHKALDITASQNLDGTIGLRVFEWRSRVSMDTPTNDFVEAIREQLKGQGRAEWMAGT